MAREPTRRGTASPSPLSSPTPSTVAAFAVRKDTASPFLSTAALRDVASPSPLSASHASTSTDHVNAIRSPRPTSPSAYGIDHTYPSASAAQRTSAKSRPATTTSSAPSSADKATERAFYRRILFQDLPATTDAPSITHDADLDHEIYLLLAYLLRETVLPWYSKLTPDREFLTQITSIITSIIHTVVQRQTLPSATSTDFDGDIHALRGVSRAELPRIHDFLSRDIPLVLRQHCADFRQAQSKVDTVWAPLGTHQSSATSTLSSEAAADQSHRRRQSVHERLPSHLREALADPSAASPLQISRLFGAASPHPGLDPVTGSLDGKIELAYLRVAVLNMLGSLLPADEYAPDTEKYIVRDVLVTVLRGALGRSFRPWFFVQSMHKALDAAGWPSDSDFLSEETEKGTEGLSSPASDPAAVHADAVSSVIQLLSRLPVILLKIWTFLVFTAWPFLVHVYLDLFNVQRAAGRKKRQHQRQQQDTTNDEASISHKGTLPSSLSTGSLFERNMHGRYPSRKFNLNQDDMITAKGVSSAIDSNPALTVADLVGAAPEEERPAEKETFDAAEPPPNYVGNWLDALEEVLLARSHVVLRATFGFARTILGTTGLDDTLNRMAVLRVDKELKDTQKLTRLVAELRRILLPGGHLSPSIPDPDVEMQEADWIRLRTRLVCSASGQDTLLQRLVKKMVLGSADSSFSKGSREVQWQDAQVQLQRVTTWLEPFCSPQAAGPNTLLAILLFERVIVALCPDLTLT